MENQNNQENKKRPTTTAKVAVLIALIIVLIASIVLPIKIVPGFVSSFENIAATLSAILIPHIEPVATSTNPTHIVTPLPEDTTPVVIPPTVTPKPTPAPAPSVKTFTDLEVRVIAIGHLDQNNFFIALPSTNTTDTLAVKFEVVNVGTQASGRWNFSATLPSQTDPIYNSDLQQSLAPGDRIEYVLGFHNPTNSAKLVAVITADPRNLITESSKTNNSVLATFR